MQANEGSDAGKSSGMVDASTLSAPHSPTTPGAYRMPVYRIGVRTGVAASPPLRPSGSVTASSSNNASVRQDTCETSTSSFAPVPHAAVNDCPVLSSPPPGTLTRNNPYAYPGSAGGVQRQPKESMSPLKRSAGNFQNV
jgi:hypothetical protein